MLTTGKIPFPHHPGNTLHMLPGGAGMNDLLSGFSRKNKAGRESAPARALEFAILHAAIKFAT
jgi:hypothetical protein